MHAAVGERAYGWRALIGPLFQGVFNFPATPSTLSPPGGQHDNSMATINAFPLSSVLSPSLPSGSTQEEDADAHKVAIDVYLMGASA